MRFSTRLLCAALGTTLLAQLSACGTCFYPDRAARSTARPGHRRRQCVGLLFYIIPGLIAFGIDFATGAIYFPEGKYSVAPEKLRETMGTDGQVDRRKLKALLEQELGRSLLLDDPRLLEQRGNAQQLAGAWAWCHRHERQHTLQTRRPAEAGDPRLAAGCHHSGGGQGGRPGG